MSFNFLTGLFHKANQGIPGSGDWPTLTDPMAGIKPQLPGRPKPTMQEMVGALQKGLSQQQPQMAAPPPMQMQQIQAAPLAQAQPQQVQGLLAPQQPIPIQRQQLRPFRPGPLAGGY